RVAGEPGDEAPRECDGVPSDRRVAEDVEVVSDLDGVGITHFDWRDVPGRVWPASQVFGDSYHCQVQYVVCGHHFGKPLRLWRKVSRGGGGDGETVDGDVAGVGDMGVGEHQPVV